MDHDVPEATGTKMKIDQGSASVYFLSREGIDNQNSSE